MAFKLGDVIIDRLQFGYGAKKNGAPLYALTQLNNANIDITADTTDINDKDGNLVYRKYSGKKGEVTAQNAFINLAIIEALSAADAEIASNSAAIPMPMIQTVAAGKTLDITDFVEDSVVVSAIYNGAIDANKVYTKATGAEASTTEFAISDNTLIPPTDTDEIEYLVKYTKNVKSGAKISIDADKFPKSHELFFKALAINPCDKENFRACVIHIPEFIPSPELSIALQGGDGQTMDYKGAVLANTCASDKTLVEVFFIDEEEEV